MKTQIKIERAAVLGDGGVAVELLLGDGEHSEKKRFVILQADRQNIDLRQGREITPDEYDALEAAAAFFEAVKKGLGLLSYGPNSKRGLVRKLVARGIEAGTAARTAEYLCSRGYINERADAEATMEAGLRKGYGSRRILAMLREKGYSDEAISGAKELLGEVDFNRRCAEMIMKKCHGRVPTEKPALERLVAAMQRYGYTYSEIREGLRILSREHISE
ncbi:MAG: regulatory protein RecX [Eubacteriales bacterium]